MPLILEDESTGLRSTDIGGMLTLSSAFYLIGKLGTGWAVDRMGAKFVFLWGSSVASCMLTGLFGVASQITTMKFVWCIVCVTQSSGEGGNTVTNDQGVPMTCSFCPLSCGTQAGPP
jgi:sugar phosphate permease